MIPDADLGSLFGKIFEILDSLYSDGLSVEVMESQADKKRQLAEVRGAKAYVGEQISKLQTTFATLGELETRLESEMVQDVIAGATATERIAPVAEPTAHAEDDRPRYFQCEECQSFHPAGFDGYCIDDAMLDRPALDAEFGADGWKEIAQAAQNGRPAMTDPEHISHLPLNRVRRVGQGPRPGSKKHRIYEATKTLLVKHRVMHIKDIYDEINAIGVFEDVHDKQGNLSNVLSQLKSQGLLVCDTRGNWSLPRHKE